MFPVFLLCCLILEIAFLKLVVFTREMFYTCVSIKCKVQILVSDAFMAESQWLSFSVIKVISCEKIRFIMCVQMLDGM